MRVVLNLTREIKQAAVWDRLVSARGGHLLQSYAWGELKSRFGWRVQRLAVTQDGEPVAGAQILFRTMPFFCLAYVPRGPVLAPASPPAVREAVVLAVLRAARAQGAFLCKLEPNALDSPEERAHWRALLLQPSDDTIQPRATIHLDLSPDLDQLLAGMKPKWRYNIRLAAKKGVVVRKGETEDLPAIYELLRVTGERDRFPVHAFDYYRVATELFADHDLARWFVATYQDRLLAAIFVSAFGPEAIYVYGASSNEERERMPNHALHWSAIQWAKERGCGRYDWWGVPVSYVRAGENGKSAAVESLPEGLYRFKQGFGGRAVLYTGAWDRVLSPWRARVYERARTWRRIGV